MLRLWLVFALTALSMAGQPARIVSTSPSITETLFALGAGPNVVGVSTYCRYPLQVQKLPKVGTYMRPDPEKIAVLRPTLVIIHKEARELSNRLQAVGVRHVEVEQGSLAQLFASVRIIGKAIGRGTAAEELVERIQTRISQTTKTRTANKRPTVLLIVGRDREQLTGLVAVGPKAYLGELLEAAGGRNVLADALVQQYPKISLETVIRLNPDVIIDSSGMGDEPADFPEKRRQVVQPWLKRKELLAVRNGKVSAILSEALVVPGPRVIEALDLLSQSIGGAGRR